MSELLPRRRWTEAAHGGLTGLLAHTHNGLLALDWDETSMCGDISYALLDELDAASADDLWGQYRHWIENDRLEAYKALARLILTDRTPEQVHRWTVEVARARVADGRMSWVPEIADLVRAVHAAGWEVWVVSGSPTPVVAALATEYGIPTDRVLGMSAPVSDSGHYLDALIEPVTWREGKAQLLQERAGRAPTLALGDSEGDVALLRAARHAVWIDKGDADLIAAAADTHWWRQEAWS